MAKSQKLALVWVLSLGVLASCVSHVNPSQLSPTIPQANPTKFATTVPTATALPDVPTPTPPPIDQSQLLPSGLRVEEHPLVSLPEIEPLVFTALDGQNEVQLMRAHTALLRQSLRPESYYGICFCTLWVMQGRDKLETAYTGSSAHTGESAAGVTRNGQLIFSTRNQGPGVTSEFRVLTTYDDHWVLELAEEIDNSDGTVYFSGRVFVDGNSLDDRYGYQESFGFQTIAGKPFYFYKRAGKVGIVYDGQEVPLGYDGVPHYGCCSGGAFNPRIARNMVAFFAWRASRWYYVEIGAFDQDR